MNPTSIEWTDLTWNPIRAIHVDSHQIGHFCEKISTGCANCYASAWNAAQRHRRKDGTPSVSGTGLEYIAKNKSKVEIFVEDKELDAPLRRRKPARIFVCDMTDLFLAAHSDEVIAEIFAQMAAAYWHTFQVLTKRPERMHDLLRSDAFRDRVEGYLSGLDDVAGGLGYYNVHGRTTTDWRAEVPNITDEWPLKNLWLGVTAEDQQRADDRISWLCLCPAAVRFVSQEPALGPVNYSNWMHGETECEECSDGVDDFDGQKCQDCHGTGFVRPDSCLDLVICGGESGPGARPCELEWLQQTVDQCHESETAVFVKQLGSFPVVDYFTTDTVLRDQLCDLDAKVFEPASGKWFERSNRERFGPPPGTVFKYPLKDRKGGDMSEWPEALRCREFPRPHAPV